MRTRQRAIRPADGGNPRAQPFKQIEMSIKRAYMLNSGLIDALAKAGSIAKLKSDRLWMILDTKDLRDAFKYGDKKNENAAVKSQAVWEWTIDHWYSGALKRSVVAMMDNLTNDNKAAIKSKVDELYE